MTSAAAEAVSFTTESGVQIQKNIAFADHNDATQQALYWLRKRGLIKPDELDAIGRGRHALTTEGMLYVNRCAWAHILSEAAKLLGIDATELLIKDEIAALNGKANPEGVII